jgi:hypothetical protein
MDNTPAILHAEISFAGYTKSSKKRPHISESRLTILKASALPVFFGRASWEEAAAS